MLRFAGGRASLRLHRRTARVGAALSLLLLALLCVALVAGDFVVTPAEVVDTLLGRPPEPRAEFFVLGRRLPRALVAMAVGACLALAGAIFQSLSRNALASPDVIGVSGGASLGAVAAMLLFGGAAAGPGAVAGAVGTAVILLAITARSGLHGARLVLTGVAVSAIAVAAVEYALSQVFLASATTAQTWLVGSLQGVGWHSLPPALLAVALATPVLWWAAPACRALALGEETALALGVRAPLVRGILLGVATLLVAAAVATTGPVSFVALAAPHLARRLCRSESMVCAALCGACLLLASDLVALTAFPAPVPAGVVTVTLGGAFFLWLLWREGRGRG
ncbi:FecCD family ABC transporter permease [Leucobacter massiliensis]|uniref:FecCD family ABC transporter permease n=1 Tax=Leucobacter massiliensis TaxID=1686285 RepID=UPI001FE52352|nr:iron chelate uptake ABC transporter family permease subunit [Leucobacter massiliensis]